jgi:hypothetical protein
MSLSLSIIASSSFRLPVLAPFKSHHALHVPLNAPLELPTTRVVVAIAPGRPRFPAMGQSPQRSLW